MGVVSRDAELFFRYIDQQPPTAIYPAWVVAETNGKVQFQTADELHGGVNANVGDTAAYQRLEGEPFAPGDCVLVAEWTAGPRVLGRLQVGPAVPRQREITAYPSIGDPFNPDSIGWTDGAIGVHQGGGFVIGADFGTGHTQVLRGDTTFDDRYYQQAEVDGLVNGKQQITHWYGYPGGTFGEVLNNPVFLVAYNSSGIIFSAVGTTQLNMALNWGTDTATQVPPGNHTHVYNTLTGTPLGKGNFPKFYTYASWVSAYNCYPNRGDAISTFSLSPNQVYMSPVAFNKNRHADRVSIRVSTASGAGGKARLAFGRLGIPNAANGSNPTTVDLIVDGGEVDISTTGTKVVTIDRFTNDDENWVPMVTCNQACTITGLVGASMLVNLWDSGGLTFEDMAPGATPLRRLVPVIGRTYGAFPSSLSFVLSNVSSGGNIPLISVRQSEP